MKIRKKILIPILALLYLAVLAFANVPPPPVNQNFGIYDTSITFLQTNATDQSACRACHTSSGTILNGTQVTSGGVPTRHHNLVSNTTIINPYTNTQFGCQDCHPTLPGGGVLLNRACTDCHNGSNYWADAVYGARVGNFAKPHHNNSHAQARNCKFCHGASVDDYNDGHYVPSYPESEITPSALFKVFNSTSGRVWGGCLACHAQDTTKTSPILFTEVLCGGQPCPINGRYSAAPIADGVNNSHHLEILPTTQGAQCTWCHADTSNVLDVRNNCEQCHSVREIHNTQFDAANTSTLIGYGHIGSNIVGANNSWDCNGCHAYWDAGDANPFPGAIIPDIQQASPTVFYENTPTVITLTGTNFVQENNTIVVNIDDTTNLNPDTISNSVITVTVNLPAGNHYIKVVKTDPVENFPKSSNIKPLTVVPNVAVTSATMVSAKSGITLTLTGTGLGATKPTSPLAVSVSHNGKQISSTSIQKWSDTQIIAKFPARSIAKEDIATVVTANSGEASAQIS